MESNNFCEKLCHNKISNKMKDHGLHGINIDEIKLFDDQLSELDILKKLCDEKENEEPFHMLNVGDILRKHLLWKQKLPKITPYYAVKCNPNPTSIKVLAALGENFDCASKNEIEQVLSYGVSSDRIIYANTTKSPSYIKFAKKVGVSMMTVDSIEELIKIKKIYPEAKILIRIRCDAVVTKLSFGEKFGCDPSTDAISLIESIIQMGLDLIGFSFHVGSPCGEIAAICRGIQICNELVQIAKSMGCKNVEIIDIGGGIPGDQDNNFDEFADKINKALENVDQSVKVISEPGRYFVTSAFTAAVCIIGKRKIVEEGRINFMYYASDGMYGSFFDKILELNQHQPTMINNNSRSSGVEKYVSIIWGPTCDPRDYIVKCKLPECNVGDWIAWFDMGSYTTSYGNNFNGFQLPKIYPIMKKSDWNMLWDEINKLQEPEIVFK